MNQYLLFLFAILMSVVPGVNAHTQDGSVAGVSTGVYSYNIPVLPSNTYCGKAPTDAKTLSRDSMMYQWGKTMRATPRGEQAIQDAYLHDEDLARAFSEAFGMPITAKGTPAIYRLINHMCEDAGTQATKQAKESNMRPRPFVVYNEPTPIPKHEEELRNNGSFPSGHSAIGMAVAMVLSEVNPSRAAQLLERGRQIGLSRVIVGFHWESDVLAGRICGEKAVEALHNNKEFMKDLEAAKKEFATLSAAQRQQFTNLFVSMSSINSQSN